MSETWAKIKEILFSLFSCTLRPDPEARETAHAAGDAERHEQHDEQQPAAKPAVQQPEPAHC